MLFNSKKSEWRPETGEGRREKGEGKTQAGNLSVLRSPFSLLIYCWILFRNKYEFDVKSKIYENQKSLTLRTNY